MQDFTLLVAAQREYFFSQATKPYEFRVKQLRLLQLRLCRRKLMKYHIVPFSKLYICVLKTVRMIGGKKLIICL